MQQQLAAITKERDEAKQELAAIICDQDEAVHRSDERAAQLDRPHEVSDADQICAALQPVIRSEVQQCMQLAAGAPMVMAHSAAALVRAETNQMAALLLAGPLLAAHVLGQTSQAQDLRPHLQQQQQQQPQEEQPNEAVLADCLPEYISLSDS